MRYRERLVGVGLAALALALLGAETGSESPARIELEVLAGMPAIPAALPVPAAGGVHVVVDLTPSLAEERRQGSDSLAASRAAAERFLTRLPQSRPVTLHALGIVSGSACAASAPALFPSGAAAAGFVRTAQPRGESSLAAALEALAAQLVEEQRGGARVVAIGDLDAGCGGDLCAAVRALDSAGADLDLVLLGGEPAPACLAGPRGAPAPVASAEPSASAPAFRVEPWPPLEGGPGADGVAGQRNVLVRGTGQLAVAIGGPEPLYVGPLQPRPGETVRLRILEFPALDVREVWVGGERFGERGRVESTP